MITARKRGSHGHSLLTTEWESALVLKPPLGSERRHCGSSAVSGSPVSFAAIQVQVSGNGNDLPTLVN